MSEVENASCLIIKEDNILLVKKAGSSLWTLPGGTIPKDEEPEAFAIRVTKEQTGVEVDILQQFNLYEIMDDDDKKLDEHVYESFVKEEESLAAGEGIEDVKWTPRTKIKPAEVEDILKQVLEEI